MKRPIFNPNITKKEKVWLLLKICVLITATVFIFVDIPILSPIILIVVLLYSFVKDVLEGDKKFSVFQRIILEILNTIIFILVIASILYCLNIIKI